MQRRDYIVSTLVTLGFRTGLKGFPQFCDCVELYTDMRGVTIEFIYSEVGVRNGCSASSVEKNLRRLFEGSTATNALSRLFGIEVTNIGNKEIIALFSNYFMLRRDCYESETA